MFWLMYVGILFIISGECVVVFVSHRQYRPYDAETMANFNRYYCRGVHCSLYYKRIDWTKV